MKILSIGNFTTGWDGSICDEEHIAKALEDAGHIVIRAQRENLFDYTTNNGFDFVLVAQWNGYNMEWLETIHKDSPIVYWAFDYQADGQEWHERLVREADLYLSKRIADFKYPNWQWLSQDFAPHFLKPYQGEVEKDIDVLFTGSYLPWATERNETIKAVNEKFNLEVYSVNDWPFLERKPPVMDHGLPELYARAKVILSIDHTLEAGYWSDRNAQIMVCKGYVLFRYVPMSEATFGPGIDYFYNIEDCLQKIEKALKDEDHRDLVARVGYEVATRTARLYVGGRVYDLLRIVENYLENRSV